MGVVPAQKVEQVGKLGKKMYTVGVENHQMETTLLEVTFTLAEAPIAKWNEDARMTAVGGGLIIIAFCAYPKVMTNDVSLLSDFKLGAAATPQTPFTTHLSGLLGRSPWFVLAKERLLLLTKESRSCKKLLELRVVPVQKVEQVGKLGEKMYAHKYTVGVENHQMETTLLEGTFTPAEAPIAEWIKDARRTAVGGGLIIVAFCVYPKAMTNDVSFLSVSTGGTAA